MIIKRLLFLLATAAVTTAPFSAQADEWAGVNTDWTADSNWVDGSAPTAGENVNINSGMGTYPEITTIVPDVSNLNIGSDNVTPSSGELDISAGGSIDIGTLNLGGYLGGARLGMTGGAMDAAIVNMGFEGAFALVNISGGATVQNQHAYIGRHSVAGLAGGAANIQISGPGTSWTTSDYFIFGGRGFAEMNVSNQAAFNVGIEMWVLGSANGAAQFYLLDGATSIMGGLQIASHDATNTNGAFMMVSGLGTDLMLDPGGTGLNIGQGVGDVAELILQDDATATTPSTIVAGNLMISTRAALTSDTVQVSDYLKGGRITIESGGSLVSNLVSIGANDPMFSQDSLYGSVSVEGLNSSLQTSSLLVGIGMTSDMQQAVGSLSVYDQAAVQTGSAVFGADGGSGDLTMYSAGSFTATNEIVVGVNGGIGTLNVTEGSLLANAVLIGVNDGIGQIYLNGASSSMDVADAIIAGADSNVPTGFASGIIDVTDSAVLSTQAITVGGNANGSLSVSLAAEVRLTDSLYVGGYVEPFSSSDVAGDGAVYITDGGKIRLAADAFMDHGAARLAVGSFGGTGLLDITGVGSDLTIEDTGRSEDVIIGNEGTGELRITDGATMHTYANQTMIGYNGIGGMTAFIGSALIDGAGSYWEALGGQFMLGVGGNGVDATAFLTVSDGGRFDVDNGYLGFFGSITETLVTGANSVVNANTLLIGVGALSTVDILDGAVLNADDMVVAYGAESEVTIDGAGSELNVANNLVIGTETAFGRGGILTVSNGGAVNANAATVTFGGMGGAPGEGVVNIGADVGDAAVAAGAFNVALITDDNGHGAINFNHTDTAYDFSTVVQGNVDIVNYAGRTILSNGNSYTGTTDVQGGVLMIEGQIESATTVRVNGRLGGSGFILNDVTSEGIIQPGNGQAPGNYNDLTIVGNYTGNAASLFLRTALGDDASLSDRLIIDGGQAIGTTNVFIFNDGGLGGQTTGDGILVVDAQNGATIDIGAFTLDNGYVDAGMYRYSLFQGGANPGDEYDLFLRSTTLRAAVPVYAATPAMSLSFGIQALGTLHDRTDLGQTLRADTPSTELALGFNGLGRGLGQTELPEGAWIRAFGGYSQFKSEDATGSGYEGSVQGVQVGKDVWRQEHADGSRDNVGLYVAQAHADGDMTSNAGKAGTASFNATSLGAYWTRFSGKGAYVNLGAQYSRIHAMKVSPTAGNGISPGGNMLSGSVEVGKPVKVSKKLVIEPQAQMIYQSLRLSDVNDGVSDIRFDTQDTVTGRAGLLARTSFDTKGGLAVQPWTRANVWHTFKSESVMTFDNTNTFTTPMDGTQGELQAGVTFGRAENEKDTGWSFYAAGGYQFNIAGASQQGWTGSLGARFNW